MPITTFRSRARVIDLLGRQQIADVPTAIGELLKNSLDAGARHAWVDLRSEPRMLIIRDDGLGMRQDDVLNKWLILATESKYIADKSKEKWLQFADEEQKRWCSSPSYGEKGIGRLSVASLGRLVILWSVWGKGKSQRGTLCLVHWNLFRHPTKLFEDLPIPYAEFDHLPNSEEINSFLQEFKTHSEILSLIEDEDWDETLRNELRDDIESLNNMLSIYGELTWEMGTSFFISGISDETDDLFRVKEREEELNLEEYTPDRLKAFYTFSTFWDPFHAQHDRKFKILPTKDGVPLKRGIERFWEPEDFENSDHHIYIEVSADGFAKGYIKNYGMDAIVYERQLNSLPWGTSSPGPFIVEIGYLQGSKDISRVPVDLHREMNERLKYAGGFSIYLNNVRVQPYGAIDSDFAGFEHRRTKNAGRYYFSTLRMFGGIFLPSKETTRLKEKAGREGFIVNGASKGLRARIEDLFVDIADSYLGRKADRKDKKERATNKSNKRAQERQEERKKEYLDKVRLARLSLRDSSDRRKTKINQTRLAFSAELNSAPGVLLDQCREAVAQLEAELGDLRLLPGAPPYGIIIDGDEYMAVQDYLTERNIAILRLEKELKSCSQKMQKVLARVKNTKEQEKELLDKLVIVEKDLRSKISYLMKPAYLKAGQLKENLQVFEQKSIGDLIEVRNIILDGLTPQKVIEDKTGALRAKWESALQRQYGAYEETIVPRLNQLVDDISHLTDETSSAFVLSELTRELQLLKEHHAFLTEMAQIGLVFETSTHEYNSHVDDIKRSIDLIRNILPANKKDIIEHLSASFSIIDERIRLYDPLIRRRGKEPAEITGKDIEEFLLRRLKFQLQGITFTMTENCRQAVWKDVKWPVFLGAIYNITYNALFWSKKGTSDACIRFSLSGKALVISDSGPGISLGDKERIFSPGFSRKPYGRGLGLYIAREALKGIKYNLICVEIPELGALDGANFIIEPQKNKDHE